ncbi:TonB family protein [Paraburkholderia acidisoli]|uniref:TonB family protein n=1 Tax=Paraburkholderia acidisoli TaxID=2571748 RepID=A0A7Z2JIF6_9BURK|nr:TonB family protein [Paraburkholderia acidisoli]QGZ65661.1 TonB family protein [Paraburkholderia acidisoli]
MASLTTATPREGPRLYMAAALALVIEAALFAVVLTRFAQRDAVPPPVRPPTLLALATAAPAPRAPALPASPVKPQPQPRAPRPVPPQRETRPVPEVTRHVAPHLAPPKAPPAPPAPPATPAAPAAPSAPAPSAATPPVHAPPPERAAPAAPSAPSPNFAGELRAAIEAALRYPESARMAGISGRTRVAFSYRDGVASDATVLVSSGVALLDRAALAAVRDARYPKPDPAFAGKTLTEQLWVNFNLDAQE